MPKTDIAMIPGYPAKRFIDFVVALIGFIITAPISGFIALIIWRRLGRPVLFVQERPGLHGIPFYLWKFRTMRETRDAHGQLLPDSERITALGRFLRRTSLDELPQLWNVLRGDLSLVGPRPLLAEYLAHYTPQQARRHTVRPGLTGWAQIHGRNAVSWEEKLALDCWYVDHISLGLDLWIMARTVGAVVRGRGTGLPDAGVKPPSIHPVEVADELSTMQPSCES